MRTHHHAPTFTATFALAFALGACGDDTAGTGGSGSGGDATSATDGASTSASTSSSASSTTSSGEGGDTGQGGSGTGGAGQGGSGTGGAGQGGSGTGGAGNTAFQAIWQNVAFPTDGGRVDIEQFSGVTLQVRVSGTDEVALELPSQTLPAGYLVHAYAIGLVADDSVDAFVVQDNDGFTLPDVGDGNIRLAHFSPGVGAVDVYLTDEDLLMYGPLLDTNTFDFPSMSRYGSFPAGTYEATVVPTGGSPFGQTVGVFPGIAIVEGESETLALVGLGEDPETVDLAVYTDDLTEPDAGFGAVTFVHAAPDAPNLDVGVLVAVE